MLKLYQDKSSDIFYIFTVYCYKDVDSHFSSLIAHCYAVSLTDSGTRTWKFGLLSIFCRLPSCNTLILTIPLNCISYIYQMAYATNVSKYQIKLEISHCLNTGHFSYMFVALFSHGHYSQFSIRVCFSATVDHSSIWVSFPAVTVNSVTFEHELDNVLGAPTYQICRLKVI